MQTISDDHTPVVSTDGTGGALKLGVLSPRVQQETGTEKTDSVAQSLFSPTSKRSSIPVAGQVHFIVHEARDLAPQKTTEAMKNSAVSYAIRQKTKGQETLESPVGEGAPVSPSEGQSDVDTLIHLSTLKVYQKIIVRDGELAIEERKWTSKVGLRLGFEPNVGKGSVAGATLILAQFEQALLTCPQEKLPDLVAALHKLAQHPFMKAAAKANEHINTTLKTLQEQNSTANRILFRNQAQTSMKGVRMVMMPSFKTYVDSGLVSPSTKPTGIDFCQYTPFEKTLKFFAQALSRDQPDISFGATCQWLQKKQATTIDDTTRMYNKDKPSLHTSEDKKNGISFSTEDGYFLNEHGKRFGDPEADDVQYLRLGPVQILSHADGSGWGLAARNAAKAANRGCIEYCQQKLLETGSLSLQKLEQITIDSVAAAQQEIISKKDSENPEEKTGATVHSVILRYQEPITGDAYAVGCLTGDMKVFVRKSDGAVRELTEGNRGGSSPVDTGGQLGARFGNNPDIRNLSAFSIKLEPGEELISMSDGVHDNLSPDELGIAPDEAYDEIMTSGSPEQKASISGITFESMVDSVKAWENTRAECTEGQKSSRPDPDNQGPWGMVDDVDRNTPEGQKAEIVKQDLGRLKAAYMRFLIERIDKNRGDIPLNEALAQHAKEMTKDARRVCEAALTMEHANLEKAKSALRKTQSDPTKTKSDRTKAEADVTRAERDLNRVQFGEPPCWAFLDPEKRRAHAGKADHISCVVLGASTSATPAT